MDTLDRVLEHDQWATSQVLTVAANLTDAQLDQEFDIGHRTVRATLDHMIGNVDGWTEAFTDQQPVSDGASVADLTARHEAVYPAFAGVARHFRDADMLEATFTDSFGQPMTFGGAVLMVSLHNEGHRSEVLHMFHRLGLADVPEVDHGLWDFARRGLLTA